MRYLLVGLGNLGQKRLAVLGARCVATVDPFNTSATYGSPQECPTDAYDCALLSVPNETKLDLIRYFLRNGKHVLVEKPLMLSRAEADELSQLARDRGAIWYTSYNHRFEPMIVQLKRLLEAETLGEIYHARLFYGNGTAQNIVGTWRERGLGVLEDLGSHLLDLAGYVLGFGGSRFSPVVLQRNELTTFDHVILSSSDERVVLEASYVCWKNTFGIDVYGKAGSAHVSGLAKWGPSELIVRQRVLPSGVPTETVQSVSGGEDPTWHADLEYFETLCTRRCTSAANDVWVSETFDSIAAEAVR
ncbi:MAG: Gfo/Idh/MocA family oxidoreductase [Chloroflexi bacterium]|nr:Gfo/Idh/MocA family oxidoreductase [Chloroflexota bacterium]MBV9546121.1 Gfo/Idh/MocA family oxidoreductase [Chloroflexota bacterium]